VRNGFVSIVVAVAAALAFACPAGADTDPSDQAYLDLLNANGLGCGQGPFACPTGDADLVQIGKSICRQLTHGNSSLAVAQQIIRQKPGVPQDTIVKFVAAAKSSYCAG
jgi:hypothetical protein